MHPKYTSGIIAIGLYFLIIGLVFYYFGYHSNEKTKHYVTKNSNAITVSLAGAKNPNKTQKKHKKSKLQSKPESKLKPRKHIKPKPIKSNKVTKTIKKSTKKPTKKIKPKSLFAKVRTSTHAKPKPKKSNNTHIVKKSKDSSQGKSSIKNTKKSDKGVENRYLAGVQSKLYGWPTQSNFAGAVVVIGLTIYPNGSFKYEILRPSSNPEFNRTIKQYLKQLQSIGFDPTPSKKQYKFKVDILAK